MKIPYQIKALHNRLLIYLPLLNLNEYNRNEYNSVRNWVINACVKDQDNLSDESLMHIDRILKSYEDLEKRKHILVV